MNCETAIARRIDFQLKPKKNVKRGIAMKLVKDKFDPRRYKTWKDAERTAIPYSRVSRIKVRFREKAIETLAIKSQ